MTPTAPRAIENMLLSMLTAAPAPLGAVDPEAPAPALAPDPDGPLAEAEPDLEAEAAERPEALPEVAEAPLARDCEVDPTEAVADPEPEMTTGADSTARFSVLIPFEMVE